MPEIYYFKIIDTSNPYHGKIYAFDDAHYYMPTAWGVVADSEENAIDRLKRQVCFHLTANIDDLRFVRMMHEPKPVEDDCEFKGVLY